MSNLVNHAAIACIKAASQTVAIAIEAAEDGVSAAELPAIIAHAGRLKEEADRLIDLAVSQANRSTLEQQSRTLRLTDELAKAVDPDLPWPASGV